MFVKIETGTKAAGMIRKVAASNQNAPLALAQPEMPQWYDVKFLAERMVDMRAIVRDAIANRRRAEQMKLRYANQSGRHIVTAEIHGHSMDIALSWHDYREATTAYHTAWVVYQKNLRRF